MKMMMMNLINIPKASFDSYKARGSSVDSFDKTAAFLRLYTI